MSNHDLELNLCGKDPKAPTEGKQSTPSDFIVTFDQQKQSYPDLSSSSISFSHSASNCDVSVLIYCPPWCFCWCPQTAARGSVCHWGPQSLWDQGQMARGWRRATEHWAAPPEIRRSHHPAAPMSPESKHGRHGKKEIGVCSIQFVSLCVFLNYTHCWKALWQHVNVCTFLRSERWQQHCRRRSSKDRMWTVLDTCLACWELDRAGSAWDKPNSWATGETERVNTILNHHYCY